MRTEFGVWTAWTYFLAVYFTALKVYGRQKPQTRQDSPNCALRHTPSDTIWNPKGLKQRDCFCRILEASHSHFISVQTILPPWTSHFKSTVVFSPHIRHTHILTFSDEDGLCCKKPHHKINFNWIAIHPHGLIVLRLLFVAYGYMYYKRETHIQ